MKRPLLFFAIAFIFGIFLAHSHHSVLLILISTAMLATVALFLCLHKKEMIFVFVGIVLSYLVGGVEFLAIDHLNTAQFKDYANIEVKIRGFIDSEPVIKDSKLKVVIKTYEMTSMEDQSSSNKSGKILLTTLIQNDFSESYGYGREIELVGLLKLPQGVRNPGGFDYRSYLASTGISANIFSTRDQITLGNKYNPNIFIQVGMTVRNRIAYVMVKSLPPQQAGLLNGMLIGYTQGLSKEVQRAFSDAGLSHIMAVSGANIAFLIFPLVFLFKKIRLNQFKSNATIIAVIAVFVLITGFTPSVMRASIMAVILLVGQMIFRETDTITSLAFAALFLLIINPYTLFDIGFQLSFVATLSILLFYPKIKSWMGQRLPRFMTDIVAVTVAVQIGIVPLTAYYFNKVSMITFLSNLIVVPILEIVTILGSVMAILGQIHLLLSQIIGTFNVTFLTFILFVTKVSSEIPGAVLQVTTPPAYMVCLYYIVVFFLFFIKPQYRVQIRSVYYFGFTGLILLLIFIQIMIPHDLQAYFIDVGQGDAVFIKTYSGKTILIDGGGYNKELKIESNIGDTVILPFLLDQGIMKLDMVIATHGHDDHIQGLYSVLKNVKVKYFVIPAVKDDKAFSELLEIANNKGIQIIRSTQGDEMILDQKTYFKVLHPSKEYEEYTGTLNNTSLVLKLQYQQTNILMVGDVEEEVEKRLVDQKVDLKSEVIKIAHHGSSSSSSADFLSRVAPKLAVVSVGKNNFGHPSDLVLERLKAINTMIFRTDEDGAILLESNGKRITVKKQVNH